jgi:hypothetical protein
MVKWTKYHFGQRPKHARTKAGAFAQRELEFIAKIIASKIGAVSKIKLKALGFSDNCHLFLNYQKTICLFTIKFQKK